MLGDDRLFYLPQCRDTLLDRITNAYFKRERSRHMDGGELTEDQKMPTSIIGITRPECGIEVV
jgi:hypothetical protein